MNQILAGIPVEARVARDGSVRRLRISEATGSCLVSELMSTAARAAVLVLRNHYLRLDKPYGKR